MYPARVNSERFQFSPVKVHKYIGHAYTLANSFWDSCSTAIANLFPAKATTACKQLTVQVVTQERQMAGDITIILASFSLYIFTRHLWWKELGWFLTVTFSQLINISSNPPKKPPNHPEIGSWKQMQGLSQGKTWLKHRPEVIFFISVNTSKALINYEANFVQLLKKTIKPVFNREGKKNHVFSVC